MDVPRPAGVLAGWAYSLPACGWRVSGVGLAGGPVPHNKPFQPTGDELGSFVKLTAPGGRTRPLRRTEGSCRVFSDPLGTLADRRRSLPAWRLAGLARWGDAEPSAMLLR